MLSEVESRNLAEASANVAQYYDVTASEKSIAWVNLVVCLSMVYAPRVIMVTGAKKAATKPANLAASTTLTQPVDITFPHG